MYTIACATQDILKQNEADACFRADENQFTLE